MQIMFFHLFYFSAQAVFILWFTVHYVMVLLARKAMKCHWLTRLLLSSGHFVLYIYRTNHNVFDNLHSEVFLASKNMIYQKNCHSGIKNFSTTELTKTSLLLSSNYVKISNIYFWSGQRENHRLSINYDVFIGGLQIMILTI